MLLSSEVVEAQTLKWVQTVNPSPEGDEANVVIDDSDYIYVSGFDYVLGASSGHCRYRLEKRRKDTGALVWTQISTKSGGFNEGPNSITSDDTYLYIGGED